ncbi:hypothetical protein N7468_003932 [Penicillium chermesinum]|uniref:TeaA receptor TeaR n=1 Tax=Penicillium chermesinum TaxID=63820 RepID=A0A9W9P7H2_9EURO|nr:uncharacterized protein N7468_003932 [Penicillium chermesinum]KAJ5239313.1 hypothetical protein N7468_003932 [Penicillium chermesinum]
MAGVATAHSSDALPSTDHSQWEFSVPIGNDSASHSSRPRNSHDSNSVRVRSSRTRNSNGSRSSSVSRNVHAHDSSYMNSSRNRHERSLNRQGNDISNARDVRGRDAAAIMIAAEGEEDDQDEMNSENWIHRDKLAKIESEELQQIIRLQRRMTETKSESGRERSHESRQGGNPATAQSEDYSEPWPQLQETQNTDDQYGEERTEWDLRRPSVVAADEAATGIYSNTALRKSSSRIPIVSPSVQGRDSRGPRSRAATEEGEEESRGRRASEPGAGTEPNTADEPTTPLPDSRPASRGFGTTPNTPKKTPAKAGSATRKTSAPPNNRKTSTARSRAVSGNTTQRPTTRSGESRPTTAVNRPEGDPPWLATMYKPDPRLPPDQQILPTVAKKLQQEQWEKEGRTPTTYDRDFAPLAVHPNDEPPIPPKEEPEEERIEPPPKAKTPEPPRPETRSGYSTMPKVQDTPPLGLTPNPNWTPPIVTAQEKPKKEKGCGCCVVM